MGISRILKSRPGKEDRPCVVLNSFWKSSKTIYLSFNRPHLKYSDVVCSYCLQYESSEIETKIQNEASCIVKGDTKLLSINNLRTETRCETLMLRQKALSADTLLWNENKNYAQPTLLGVQHSY